jgi:hypothetical protein
VATKEVQVTLADTLPPTIWNVPDKIEAFATSTNGAKVAYPPIYAADDVQGPVNVQFSRPPNSQYPLGKSILRIRASDFSLNKADMSVPVVVTYDCAGFVSPTSDASFQAGSLVSARIRLRGDSAGVSNADAKLYVRQGTGPETLVGAFEFRSDSRSYLLQWSTVGLAAGDYQLRADLGDGRKHTVLLHLTPLLSEAAERSLAV